MEENFENEDKDFEFKEKGILQILEEEDSKKVD